MTDTPRTDAAMHDEHDPYIAVASECAKLERELNGSNKIIRQQQLLDEENLMLKNRIKRLEEMYEGEIGERPEFLGSNLKGLLIRELNLANNRIKQLEKALEATAMIIGPPGHSEWATDDEINHAWGLYIQTKEIKP